MQMLRVAIQMELILLINWQSNFLGGIDNVMTFDEDNLNMYLNKKTILFAL